MPNEPAPSTWRLESVRRAQAEECFWKFATVRASFDASSRPNGFVVSSYRGKARTFTTSDLAQPITSRIAAADVRRALEENLEATFAALRGHAKRLEGLLAQGTPENELPLFVSPATVAARDAFAFALGVAERYADDWQPQNFSFDEAELLRVWNALAANVEDLVRIDDGVPLEPAVLTPPEQALRCAFLDLVYLVRCSEAGADETCWPPLHDVWPPEEFWGAVEGWPTKPSRVREALLRAMPLLQMSEAEDSIRRKLDGLAPAVRRRRDFHLANRTLPHREEAWRAKHGLPPSDDEP